MSTPQLSRVDGVFPSTSGAMPCLEWWTGEAWSTRLNRGPVGANSFAKRPHNGLPCYDTILRNASLVTLPAAFSGMASTSCTRRGTL
ncbi:hypothetical protein THL1_4404 [Pseudomonas sp. TCU-HL1]|nr:hypothetical protein THL1_4404 [Pseudomonas sp. TCU-HL1]